jgi:hypothetical protein
MPIHRLCDTHLTDDPLQRQERLVWHPRSAALVIVVHLDEEPGAPSYATLEAYDSLADSRYLIGRASDADDLVRIVRRWLESVLAGQRRGSDTG